MAKDVVVDRLRAVEDRDVRGPGEAHAPTRRRRGRRDGGLGLGEELSGPADLGREQGAQLRLGGVEAEVGRDDAEAVELLGGQIDPVEPVVDAHVADEVRELEGDA